nr:TPA_asm: ATP8 [Bombus skorikovi]
MPQMKPINWLLIFTMCLISLLIMMILINTFYIILTFKNKMKKKIKKWKWSW